LSKGNKAGLDSSFCKAARRGIRCQTYTIDELLSAGDKKKIFREMTSSNKHCLHSLLPYETSQSTKFFRKPWTQIL